MASGTWETGSETAKNKGSCAAVIYTSISAAVTLIELIVAVAVLLFVSRNKWKYSATACSCAAVGQMCLTKIVRTSISTYRSPQVLQHTWYYILQVYSEYREYFEL